MSTMERRLQILLDDQRYQLLAAEAQDSGRSVASIIREAIDLRFDSANLHATRQAAAARFLDRLHANDDEPAFDPAADTGAYLDHLDHRSPA